jgi:hypothetical protein
MARDDVFPAEMPDNSSKAIVPLDPDTAERLLSGRLDPDDAPPGYAEVARLLQAAATPPDPGDLTGQAAAIARFRLAHRGPGPPSPAGRGAGRGPAGATRGPARAARGRARGARGRLVALALAGAVAVGGVGVWTAGGAPLPGELGSPSGGPSAGGRGSGAPGSGAAGPEAAGSGAGTAGALRPVRDGVGVVPGAASSGDGYSPAGAAGGESGEAREPAAARHGGDVTSGGGSGSGTELKEPGNQGGHGAAKPRPPKPKPPKPNPPTPKPPKANDPKPTASKG